MQTTHIMKRASALLAVLMASATLTACNTKATLSDSPHTHYHTVKINEDTNLEHILDNAEVDGAQHLANKNGFDLIGYTAQSGYSDNYMHSDNLVAFHDNTMLVQTADLFTHRNKPSDYSVNTDTANHDPSTVYADIAPYTLTLRRNTMNGSGTNTLKMVKYRLHNVQHGIDRHPRRYLHRLSYPYRYIRVTLYPYEIERKHTDTHTIPSEQRSLYKLKLTIIGYLHNTNGTLPYE